MSISKLRERATGGAYGRSSGESSSKDARAEDTSLPTVLPVQEADRDESNNEEISTIEAETSQALTREPRSTNKPINKKIRKKRI